MPWKPHPRPLWPHGVPARYSSTPAMPRERCCQTVRLAQRLSARCDLPEHGISTVVLSDLACHAVLPDGTQVHIMLTLMS